jgi:vacuolar protein sorting-associated protein 54
MLKEYRKAATRIPGKTSVIARHIVDLFKVYNDQVYLAILKAKAVVLAGLRNITAKHIALALQALAVLVALVPWQREAFLASLDTEGEKQALLREFDQLLIHIKTHQQEQRDKLVTIMRDRATHHCTTIAATDWNAVNVPEGITPCMDLLVREIVTLHKVLARYLPRSELLVPPTHCLKRCRRS